MSSSEASRNRRFVEQVLPHASAAYNLARWLSRSDANARDIVQETFVRALRYFDSYHGGSARAWLLTIVRNTTYTWLSANPPTAQLQLAAVTAPGEELGDADHGTSADPLVGLARQEEAIHLREAIAQLPVEYREVLILRELEELSYRQIATIVGCPIGTVMSRLSRARNELGDRLRREAGST
jgi:RNA polymerase sigma factor (sigma-70 family)